MFCNKGKFYLLYVVCSYFIIYGVKANVNSLRNEDDGIYSECIRNGDFAITFGNYMKMLN